MSLRVEIEVQSKDGASRALLSPSVKDFWNRNMDIYGDVEPMFDEIQDAIETLRLYGIPVPLESVSVDTDGERAVLSRFPDGSYRVTYDS